MIHLSAAPRVFLRSMFSSKFRKVITFCRVNLYLEILQSYYLLHGWINGHQNHWWRNHISVNELLNAQWICGHRCNWKLQRIGAVVHFSTFKYKSICFVIIGLLKKDGELWIRIHLSLRSCWFCFSLGYYSFQFVQDTVRNAEWRQKNHVLQVESLSFGRKWFKSIYWLGLAKEFFSNKKKY